MPRILLAQTGTHTSLWCVSECCLCVSESLSALSFCPCPYHYTCPDNPFSRNPGWRRRVVCGREGKTFSPSCLSTICNGSSSSWSSLRNEVSLRTLLWFTQTNLLSLLKGECEINVWLTGEWVDGQSDYGDESTLVAVHVPAQSVLYKSLFAGTCRTSRPLIIAPHCAFRSLGSWIFKKTKNCLRDHFFKFLTFYF